jgi:hypothetical protein
MHNGQHKSFSKRLFSGSWWALFTVSVWELLEECIETVLAFCVSEVVTIFILKVLSTLAVVGATQGIKVCIKRFLIPIIKTLIYKEGFDKMSKIKKFFTWVWANKKTLLGTASTAVASLSAMRLIPAHDLPVIAYKGINVTNVLYYATLAVIALLGVFGVGFEKIEEFFKRKGLIKAQKEEKAIVKEAKKEIVTAQKTANQTQAQQEKARTKALAEAQAKAEKEKADAEHRAKVEQAKAKLIAEQQIKS